MLLYKLKDGTSLAISIYQSLSVVSYKTQF